jgi:hypothetical protein
MAVWGGRTTEAERKLVLTLALILAFSPWEKESPWHVFDFSDNCPANPVASFSKDGGRFSLSANDSWGRGPG